MAEWWIPSARGPGWNIAARPWDYYGAPANMPEFQQVTEDLLHQYYAGTFRGPMDFADHIHDVRMNDLPSRNIPDPGPAWEENLLRHIGFKRTPHGIFSLDEEQGTPMSQREDILGTIHWPYRG